VLASLAACAEAHTAGDETACSTEAECTRLYRVSLERLQACLGERRRAGYVGPGSAPPPACEVLKADHERWAAALTRLRGRKQQEAAEEQTGGFEVPPLPPPKATAAP
jgi:hypothetical protein